MALLKSLIQRLLDSRTTPEEAGHSAMPDYSVMTTFTSDLSGTGTIYEGVAPSDGYLYIRARHAENASHLNVDTDGKWITCPSPFKGSLSGMMKPVKKGQSFTLAGNSISEVVVGFIAVIGGGYNSFIRRALSCLRPSFNFSQRSSFRTNPSGSATKQCRSLTRQTKLNSRRQISTLSTLRQVMATSPCSRETTSGLNCTTEIELSLVLHPAQRTVIYKWPQLRVQELTTWLANRMEALQKSLFPLLQQSERDALTGGALC